MGILLGALNITDANLGITKIGQQAVFDVVNTLFEQWSRDTLAMSDVFISGKTEKWQDLVQLPGSGRLAQVSPDVKNIPTSKSNGSWTVSYPLINYAAAYQMNFVTAAYMTVGKLEAEIQGMLNKSRNTLRYDILRHCFNNTNLTHTDEWQGALTIKPIANGDSDLYPPIVGSDVDATDNHFLESGYAASAISDTNNPIATLGEELREHWLDSGNEIDVICFINSAQKAKIEALSDYEKVLNSDIRPGDDTAVPLVDRFNVPGKKIGVCNGALISQWNYVPANYVLAVYVGMGQPAPFKMRVDTLESGLPQGMPYFIAGDNEMKPFMGAQLAYRYGVAPEIRYGVAVMELGTGGSYTVPTGY